MWEVRGIAVTEVLAFVLMILFFCVPASTSNEWFTMLAILCGLICAASVFTHEWLSM